MTGTDVAVLVHDVPLGLALMRALEEGGALTRSSLVVTDPDLTIDRFEMMLALFGEFKRACSFYIGDLQNFADQAFGEEVYPNREDRFVELTGLKHETLRNYANVCARVAVPRRRDDLSFGHHADVASCEPSEQVRWLELAASSRWTRAELREQLKGAGVLPTRRPDWTPPGELLGPLAAHDPADASAGRQEGLPGTDLAPVAPASPPVPASPQGGSEELLGAARRLVEAAEPGEGYYRVPSEAFDEVAALVVEE